MSYARGRQKAFSQILQAKNKKNTRGCWGQTHKGKKSNLVMISIEAEQTIDKMWDQDECSTFCTKEELWEEFRV